MNAIYDKGREKFGLGGINWVSDTVKVVLVNTTVYVRNLAVDEFLSTIVVSARVAAAIALANKGMTAGVASADNLLFPLVTGSVIGAIVIYKDTGSDATSPLIAYVDTATGLPFTPNGGNIVVAWDTGPNKVFKL